MNIEKILDENPEYKEKYGLLTEAEKQRLPELLETVERILESVLPIVREVVKQAVEMATNVIRLYPNKRVVYLALHGKKKRTRKKNFSRIINDIQSGGRIS